MANLPLTKLVLYDRFPGTPSPVLGKPTNGWDNAGNGCVTTAEYPLGTKIIAYSDNTHNPGWYTMYYGTLACYSSGADVSDDFSDGKFWCSHCCLTADAADAWAEYLDSVQADPRGGNGDKVRLNSNSWSEPCF